MSESCQSINKTDAPISAPVVSSIIAPTGGKYRPPVSRLVPTGTVDSVNTTAVASRPSRWSQSIPGNQTGTGAGKWNAREGVGRPPSDDRFACFGKKSTSSLSSHGPGFRGLTPGGGGTTFNGSIRAEPALERELFNATPAGINFDKYDEIPVSVEDTGTDASTTPVPIVTLDETILGAPLAANVVRAGYTKPTPIQKHAIPIGLAARDLMGCAQTGSGKTAGFLFPIITGMLARGPVPIPPDATLTTVSSTAANAMRRRTAYPNALILAPTRELAVQIFEEARKFCYMTGLRPVVVYGGAEQVPQLRELERGADILVATPGRLLDFVQRGRVSLSCVKNLVLDEADRMLDMGFEPQIRQVVEKEGMPTADGDGRQTFMFSATFPREIRRLAQDFMRPYIFVTVGTVGSPASDITQTIEWVEEGDKHTILVDRLKAAGEGRILVFVATKRAADSIQFDLIRSGFIAIAIHGDRTQREREDALAAFKSGECPILVATDVASRGLDVTGVTLVVNYDMPTAIDDYVHRIGRTGRAGHKGAALTFFNSGNEPIARDLYNLLKDNGQEAPDWMPDMASGKNTSRGSGGRPFGRPDRGRRFGQR